MHVTLQPLLPSSWVAEDVVNDNLHQRAVEAATGQNLLQHPAFGSQPLASLLGLLGSGDYSASLLDIAALDALQPTRSLDSVPLEDASLDQWTKETLDSLILQGVDSLAAVPQHPLRNTAPSADWGAILSMLTGPGDVGK